MTRLGAGCSDPKRHTVFYDGACAFCLASVNLLKKLDWGSCLAYVDMRKNAEALQRVGMPPDQALEQMHVLPKGRVALHGFDAIRWLAWRLPALWAIAPFLYLPGVAPLGRRVYLWIARNRFRL